MTDTAYDANVYTWTKEQVSALRTKEWTALNGDGWPGDRP